jgi:flagellar motor switch protein FliM
VTLPAETRAEPATLIRSESEAPAYPGLERVGQKLARGLAEFLTGLMAIQVGITASTLQIGDAPADDKMAFRHLRIAPPDGRLTIGLARVAVMRLVDLYYGGEGAGSDQREGLSPAEERFFTRIASAARDLLPAAWLPYGTITAELDEEAGVAGSRIVMQQLLVSLPDREGFEIELRYPLAVIEAVPTLGSDASGEVQRELVDNCWQTSLMECALGVAFPVRAIFAEPELPLARLMSLKAGDVIPICLPAHIDLNICGLRFARGSAGESNGRAAICIDQL